MKFIFILLCALFFISPTWAQKKADSLRGIWHNESIGHSNRLLAMYLLIDGYYFESKIDSALILSTKMLDYAQEKKNLKYEIEAHTLIGRVYFQKKDIDNGYKNYNRGLELAKTIEDSIVYSKKLQSLGQLYYDHNDYANAFRTFQKSHKISVIVGDSLNEGWSQGFQGFIFSALGDFRQAEKYHLEHLRLSTKYNLKHSIAASNGNLGQTYSDLGNLPQSIIHWNAGIKIAKESGFTEYAALGTNYLIACYIKEKQFDNAIKYLDEYKEVAKIFNSSSKKKNDLQYKYKLHISRFQCQINYGLGKYNIALKECYDCLKLYKTEGDDPHSSLIETLYLVNKELDRHEEALGFFEKYQVLIANEEKIEARSDIQNIIFNNQLATDSIAQVQEKQSLNKAYADDLRKKNTEKNFYLIIGLMVLLSAIALYSRLRFVRKSRAKLNIEKNRAEKSEQIKQDFLANMSHEIRTPMNAVLGMTNLVLDMSLGDKQRYYLNGIKKSGDNLLHIINDILDLSKMEAGKMELDEIDFSIRDSVEQVKQMLEHRASEKDLELLALVEADVHDIVIGDPMRLNQVLINLIGNAIKFTLKGSVSLQVKNVDDGVQFNIIDTGIGIPEDKLKAVFESFSQANTSDTRKYGGTGLGLSISQQLVELMNSSIDIESKEGYGTTFSFIINFEEGSIERLNQRLSVDEMIDGSILDGLNILLVDDNEYNIIVARDTLKSKSKVKIVEAYNGQEAIDLFKVNDFDVILMDVQMPVMNGFDATTYIRSNFESPKKEIPIIALTASVLRTDLDKCIDAGMTSYVPKPFKAYQLISEIANVLNIEIQKRTSVASLNPKIESGEVTDLTYLTTFCEGDDGRIKKYVNMFLSSAPQVVEKIRIAMKQNDFEEIANNVHGFKMKCTMMGMTETKELSNTIEYLCREKPNEEILKEKVSKLISNIEKAANDLRKFSK